MSIYTFQSINSINSLQNSQHDSLKIQRHYLMNDNPQQCNISQQNSLSEWNRSKLSNSAEKSHFADLQNISQSIPNFGSFLQSLSNIKSSRSIEDDFMDNHIDAYYQAVHKYALSFNSQFISHRKIRSFLHAKLYTGTTYEPKRLQILIKECVVLSADQKQTLLAKFKKQTSLKQFFQKILSHQALQISYELLLCLITVWSQYSLNYDSSYQTQLKQNCSIKARKIVQSNWQNLYYHQNIKFINMRKASTVSKESKQLSQLFTIFLLKFTETILFILQGFFSHNLYENLNLNIVNKENLLSYKNHVSKQLIQKIELKRSFKSFKLISSSLDIIQSQQSDDQCLYRKKPRKRTKIQNIQLNKHHSNTSMEFTF